ncbi:ECF transporter S component [Bacillus sp. HNG]|uniref:ECF transporter S component n=1 Tax=Bacillus sp. HNG TaxID=2293325 RepID=UPI001CB9BB06|nr:ECF transporter S component [Bacillus sp. HNG]
MRNVQLRKIIFTALCISIGLIFAQIVKVIPIPYPGAVLLPMHIPVLICGFLCGRAYGALSGLLLPLIGFILTGMPPIFPTGLSMMLELATYGALTAIIFDYTKGKVYISLIGAMIGGRIVMGIVNTVLLSFTDNAYGWAIFISGSIVTALPGIIIQLILIPIIVLSLKRAKLITIS